MQDYEVWTTRLGRAAVRAHEQWLRRGKVGAGRLEVQDANLRNARVNGDITYSRFVDCDLSGAVLELQPLDGVEFIRSRCVGMTVSSSGLNGARLIESDFASANMRFAKFRSAELVGVSCKGSKMERAIFMASRLTRCDLESAVAMDSVWSDTQIVESRLVDANLQRDAVHLDLATMSQVDVVGCDLRGVRVQGLRLRGVKFIRCRMHGIQGKPVLEGPVEVIDPDLSVAGDGSKIVAGSEVLKAWA